MTRSSPAEQSASDAEPNFTRPRPDVISEDNWQEYEAKGYGFLENQDSLTDPAQRSELDRIKRIFGSENVVTGHAFDLAERRPLRHKPGIGIYIAPEADLKLAKDAEELDAKAAKERQSSDTGPASS
jgi:hypothetical protein